MDPLQRLQDNVNRMQWKKCTFSGNGIIDLISLSLHYFASFIIMFVNYSLLFLSSVPPLFVAILMDWWTATELTVINY